MDKLDKLIIKLENEIEVNKVVRKELGLTIDDKLQPYEDAADYLNKFKQIKEIANKDDGKSATKSFENMIKIKEIIND